MGFDSTGDDTVEAKVPQADWSINKISGEEGRGRKRGAGWGTWGGGSEKRGEGSGKRAEGENGVRETNDASFDSVNALKGPNVTALGQRLCAAPR
jgi:hypothetical protein